MILNENALICTNEYGPTSSIWRGGQTFPEFPLENLLSPELYKPTKFLAKNTFTIFDLGKIRGINVVSILKHNLTYVATWRVRIYQDDPDSNSPIFDSGFVPVFPYIDQYGLKEWGEFLWGGNISMFAEVTPSGYNLHSFMPIDTKFGRYIRIDLLDMTNTAPLSVGRFWASRGYQPSLNISYGSHIQPIDKTEVSEMVSGVRQYGRNIKRKSLFMIFEMLPSKELLFNIFGPISLDTGRSKEMLVLLFPMKPETWFFESVFGNMTEVDKSDYVYFNRMGTTINVEEAV